VAATASGIDPALLQQMNQAQYHRGPDEGNQFVEGPVGLAHRRLSIIDIASGQQPLTDAEHRAVIIFNGEIYNFRELRSELEHKGFHFRTHSDTEVILNAWCAWGEECVTRLRGMFAFAVWDFRKQCLFLARDRLGIKPLYYAWLHGQLVFASELKGITCHPGLQRNLNPEAVEDFFALGYIPDPKTIFSQVHKLPPGHTLLCYPGQPPAVPRRYWDASFAETTTQSAAELREELIERLREAVSIRLMSEVPLGAFLSGGVDSSAVVAMMAEAMDEPVNTCSIGFDVPGFNETDFARQVAGHFHTRHSERQVRVDDFDLIDQLAQLYDEPFADSSAIPTYRVCQLAREKVTVCLSGDGGDEVFAGYRRHRWHMLEERVRAMVPLPLRKPVFGLLGRCYPKLDWAPKYLRAKSTFQALQRESLAAYLHSVGVVDDGHRRRLFSPAMKRSLQGYRTLELFEQHRRRFDGDDPLALVQYLDLKTYLPGDILTKVDRASMAHSLEVRVPLLDHRFIEWANRVPGSLKLHGREGKYLFKQALEPRLPQEVLYRAKMGFAVPVSRWFRGPLQARLEQRLLNGALGDSGLFDMGYVSTLVRWHCSGQAEYGSMLWSLLMFESFCRSGQVSNCRSAA